MKILEKLMKDNRGNLNNLIEGSVLLLVFMVSTYAVLLVWGPITATGLFPLLLNAEAFTHGGTMILLFQAMPLVLVVMAFVALVTYVRQGSEPKRYY